ncbi:MAG: cyclic nucleotide-binding domain-containing protein [Mariprofundaceae bacterium]
MSIDLEWLGKEILGYEISEAEGAALSCITVESFKEWDTIIKQGQQGGSLFFLRSGVANIEDNTDGERVRIAGVEAGSLFGEMTFLNNHNTTAEIMAGGNCEVYKLTRDDFSKLMSDHQELAYAILSKVLTHQTGIIQRMNGELLPILRNLKKKAESLPLVVKLFPVVFITIYVSFFLYTTVKDFTY